MRINSRLPCSDGGQSKAPSMGLFQVSGFRPPSLGSTLENHYPEAVPSIGLFHASGCVQLRNASTSDCKQYRYWGTEDGTADMPLGKLASVTSNG